MMTVRRTYKRVLLLLADLHVGSRYSIFPYEFETKEGQKIIPSDQQWEVLEYWHSLFSGPLASWNYDTVVLLGDMLEGLNRKEGGHSLMFSDLEEQERAALTLLSPVCKGKKVVVTDGSGYHGSLDTRVHKHLSDKLNGSYVGYVANIGIAGTDKTMNIAHGEGGSTLYRGTMLDREAMYTKLAEACGMTDKVDIIARGHYHFCHITQAPYMSVVFCPSWKMFEASKITMRIFGKSHPNIGCVVVAIRDDGDVEIARYLMPSVPRIDHKLTSV